MSTWVRLLLAIVVAMHGIGHVLFLVSLLGVADWEQSTYSWLLRDGWLAKGAGSLIWLVAIIGFVVAAFGLFRGAPWWQTAAVVSAAISAVGLFLFWRAPVSSPVYSALLFDLLILAALLLFHWPPVAQAGR